MARMLIVEDDPVSSRLMAYLLTKHGQCDIAADGRQALDFITRSYSEDQAYDVVFLDIRLPGMRGEEVLAGIRSLEASRGVEATSGVKVVMTTGLSDDQSVLDAHLHGCNEYLVKPILPEELTKVLKSLGIVR